jgi:hypothetical protein
MPMVTLDTSLAERADLATLIDVALRQRWDVAVVEVWQSDVAPPCLYGCKPVGEPSGADGGPPIRVRLRRVLGMSGSELMAESPNYSLSGSFCQWSFNIQDYYPSFRGDPGSLLSDMTSLFI